MINHKKEVFDYFIKRIGKQFYNDPIINLKKYAFYDLDAENLMSDFFEQFDIKYDNFEIEKYFIYPDYSWKDLMFFRLFFPDRYPQKPYITIEHLIKVVERGEWFDPE